MHNTHFDSLLSVAMEFELDEISREVGTLWSGELLQASVIM